MALTDLPDLPLLNIFNRLPVWKILQLSKLCHRLNYIKREVFRKQTQLRLLGGCQTSNYNLSYLKKYIHSLDLDQNEVKFNFDLILKFDNKIENSFENSFENYFANRGKRDIELSHDIHVRNLEQITNFAQIFPNLKRLVVAFTNDWESRSLEQMMRNWPTLTHLYLVDFQLWKTRDSLDYENALMAINSLHDLQVLAIYYPEPCLSRSRNWPLNIVVPLLQSAPNLSTLYFKVGLHTRLVGRQFEFEDQRLNVLIPFDRFERFGLVDYCTEGGPMVRIVTSEQFISRTTRLKVDLGTDMIHHLVNWSALQYLSLTIDFEDLSLFNLLNPLTRLHNLQEFHLFDNSEDGGFRMPLESLARQLPQLVSVRRFEFCSRASPYKLYRFKWALPNVADLRLRLPSLYELPIFKDLESFCNDINLTFIRDLLPESCVLDMKRAFLTYGNEIQHFYWIYYRNGRKGDGQAELVPMVERYTKMISGMSRLNFDLEEIEKSKNDID